MHLNRKSVITIMMILIAILASSVSVQAFSAQNSKTENVIRIGVMERDNYAQSDKDGSPCGTAVEFLYALSAYADIYVAVIPISDASSMFASLKNGTVDTLMDVVKTDERQKQYLFSDFPTGEYSLSVYVPLDSMRNYAGISELDNMTVGVEKESCSSDMLPAYFRQHGISVKCEEYPDIKSINKAIDSGMIDAGVYATAVSSEYKTLLQLPPVFSYFVFRSGNPALKTRLDYAISQFSMQNPGFNQNSGGLYPLSDNQQMPVYSVEEKNYIASHPVTTVAVLRHDEPYFSIDQSGKYIGILPDYYQILSLQSGLHFKFKVYDNQTEANAAVKNKEADILSVFSSGPVAAHELGYRLTSSYGTSIAVLISKTGTSQKDIKKIACKGRNANIIQKGLDPATISKLVTYDTSYECFDALRKGNVDAIISGLPGATWTVNQADSSAYTISAISTIELRFCGALNFSNNILWSILNKAIAVSNYSFNSIVTRNTLAENTWSTFITRIPSSMLTLYTVFMLLTVIVLISAIFSLIRRQKERTQILRSQVENERKSLQLASMEKSVEERNRFFSNISHDMRTPLNAIIGFADLAGQKTVSSEVQDYLIKIRQSGNLLLDLINDTLTLSKISSKKLFLCPAPVSAWELVDEVETPIRKSAEEKHITFIVDKPPRDRIILVDKLNLQKIFLNLLSNAVKYTPSGGTVEFRLHYVRSADPDPDTIVTIKDNGIGISEAFLPHIYEPFEQEHQNGSYPSGTGLGLSIVKQLVDFMQGDIQVTSVLQKGTTFTLKFHFAETNAIPETLSIPDAKVPVCFEGKKLLLCEDNQLNTEVACEMLKLYGFKLDTAANGNEGLQLFEKSSPYYYAAILMDLRMPVMDGYEATASIRLLQRPDAKTIPIIAMTADAFDEDIQNCLKSGMNAHISKPINPEILKKTLLKWIRYTD